MRREQGLRLHTEARTDWFRILADLRAHGIDVQGVADTTGVPRTTILGWKQGAEPRHADGERLVRLWCAVIRQPREALPMTRCPEWLEA